MKLTKSSSLLTVCLFVLFYLTCRAELVPRGTTLMLTSPGSLDYSSVLVKRVGDNLTLTCRFTGDTSEHDYVWNYLPKDNRSTRAPTYWGPPHALNSTITMPSLQLNDTGQFICSSPPLSVKKYVVVQARGILPCARGGLWCEGRCVLPLYICDGHSDCLRGEDEAPHMCGSDQPCRAGDRLNCTAGRCIPEAACCGLDTPLCRQPTCCEENHRYASTVDGYVEEYPALFEDRHAPDDYGFIQSTIYTVTACALIFMIAVVLLVSAICRMHMKRAALRAAARHCGVHYAQAHRFPPCYEASRLLEQEARAAAVSTATAAPPVANAGGGAGGDSAPSNAGSPAHCAGVAEANADAVTSSDGVAEAEATGGAARPTNFGLGRLVDVMFNARYRQVPTQCCDVEMRDVRSSSLTNSPTRPVHAYRSPTFCDFDSTDFYFTSPETAMCGRELNCNVLPSDVYDRRILRRANALERLFDRIDDNDRRPRNLTLHLGRFQFSIPRLGRRRSTEGRRPDTPNIAEINIDDLDFVRLNSNETYTLNGRTIRLLGASFENCPSVLSNTFVSRVTAPPPYSEIVSGVPKSCGPPPEYLSRENLAPDLGTNTCNNVGDVNGNLQSVAGALTDDNRGQNDVELPPRYEELPEMPDYNANQTTKLRF